MKLASVVAVLLVTAATEVRAASCEAVTFEGLPAHYAGPRPRTFELANLNRDEWPDAIVGSFDHTSAETRIGNLTLLVGHRGGNWSVLAELEPTEHVMHVEPVDFDGDGDDDVAYFVSTRFLRELRVLRNDNPGFTRVATYPAEGTAKGGLAAGDFNGDRKEDLVFTMERGSSRLLLSEGDGRFALLDLPLSHFPPAVADLNRDGFADLVLSEYPARRVRIYTGRQTGLLAQTPVTINGIAGHVLIGDFDGNGRLDVLAAHAIGVQQFDMISNAATSMQTVSAAFTTLHVTQSDLAAVGDLDRDGVDDLAWVQWRGVQTAFFQRLQAPSVGNVWFVPGRFDDLRDNIYHDSSVATADLDRDGDTDVVVLTDDGLRTLFNDGTGKFAAPKFATQVRATGDFNDDGRDDVLDHQNLLLANANGELPSVPHRTAYLSDYWWVTVRTAAADVDGDGNLDAVWLRAPDNLDPRYSVRVRFGNGDGTLDPPMTHYFLETEDAEHMLVRDFTGDGRADVFVTFDDGVAAVLLVASANGTFASEQRVSDISGDDVEAGDVDGDGDLDVVGNYVMLNDGAGRFQRIDTPRKEFPGSGGVFESLHEVADLNDDGRADIVVEQFANRVDVWLSTGGGQFARTQTLTTGLQGLWQFDVRDFNGDGHADLLVAEGRGPWSTGFLRLWDGNGTGSFQRSTRIRAGALGLVAGDFNGDGLFDIADAGFVRLARCATTRSRAVRH
jgi:hypothetical protein